MKLSVFCTTIASAILFTFSFSVAENTKPYNLLFIMTDQHRHDVIGTAGNPVIQTPHMDFLAADGVRFSSAFTVCPVCTPSRTSMFVGRSIGNTGISTNAQSTQDTPETPLLQMKSYDKILNENGFFSEYHGKWHSPLFLAGIHKQGDESYFYNFLYSILPNGKYANSEKDSLSELIRTNAPFDISELKNGLQFQRRFFRPYAPVSVDVKFGLPSPKSIGKKGQPEDVPSSEAADFGQLILDAKYSQTSFQRDLVLQALDNAKKAGKPFNITASISFPHPPMVVTEPYFSKYRDKNNRPIKELDALVEPSIGDRSLNSPYPLNNPRRNHTGHFNEPQKITDMTAVYYGLVTEVDDAIGQIIQKLKDIGEYDDTLIIYTSDHGEMLGSHGLNGKGNFYDASIRIPLILKEPKGEHKGLVIDKPVMSTDLFATILDYTISDTKTPSDGQSLRTLIENPGNNSWRDFAVSEWNHFTESVPSYCITTKDWKLMLARSDKAKSALYDRKNDPNELKNLLPESNETEVKKYRFIAEELKQKLVDYLKQINHFDSRHIESFDIFVPVSVDNIRKKREVLPRPKRGS
ncbi:MAG: sulfatase-like hydrolase/transferase [Planctomycetaceae bacterium]|nr:sulfatase-like hydrolase/transferase [Planctomycetaceae bacterium]